MQTTNRRQLSTDALTFAQRLAIIVDQTFDAAPPAYYPNGDKRALIDWNHVTQRGHKTVDHNSRI